MHQEQVVTQFNHRAGVHQLAKRRSGKRTDKGRLTRAKADPRQAWDYGNTIVQARRALFDSPGIKDGKAADQVHDAIGQLWALDMLEGYGIDSVALRDKGRDYAAARLAYWGGRLSASDNEPRSRTSQSKEVPPATKPDLYFERIDGYLERGSPPRAALYELLVDHDGDDIAPWAARLIARELMKRGRIRFAEPRESWDEINLVLAICGLCALVECAAPKRVAA